MHTLLRGELYKDPRHPLYNFIFKYYFSMSPKCLTHYSPGMNVLLLDAHDGRSGAPLAQSSWGDPYLPVAKGYVWDPAELAVTAPKRKAMAHVLQLLQSIDKKPPSLRCYGLHEWAMVYTDETSHEDIAASSSKLSKFQTLPLRVSSEDIRRVLWPDPASPPLLRCTHFDAFRFFTEDGRVLNTVTSPTPARYIPCSARGDLSLTRGVANLGNMSYNWINRGAFMFKWIYLSGKFCLLMMPTTIV